jgi:hypothetical protein
MAKKPEKWMQKAVPQSHRGIFTAKARKAGMSVAEFASKTLAAGSKANTKTKREAVFAQNAAKIAKGR